MKRALIGIAALLAGLPTTLPAQVQARSVASPALSTGIVAKDSSGQLVAVNVVAGASAGFVLVLDAKTIPAPGAVTPIKCMALAATASTHTAFGSAPVTVGNGIVVLFSTGANCFTYAASATAFISADVQ